MKVSCPSCHAVYKIPDEKIPKNRTGRATCAKCKHRFIISSSEKTTAPAQPVSDVSPELLPKTTVNKEPPVQAEWTYADTETPVTFSYGDCLRFAWHEIKTDPALTIAGLLVIPMAVQMIPQLFVETIPEDLWFIGLVIALAAAAAQMIVTLGIAGITLKICDGRLAGFGDLLAYYPLLLTYFLSSLLLFGICFIGFLLLIIPGIIFMLWFQFYVLAIVDKNAGPVEALKISHATAKGNFRHIFVFWCVMFAVNLVGMIPCGLGLFVTVPMSFIAWAYLYRTLQGRTPTIS